MVRMGRSAIPYKLRLKKLCQEHGECLTFDGVELQFAVHLPVGQHEDVLEDGEVEGPDGVEQRLGRHAVPQDEHHQEQHEVEHLPDLPSHGNSSGVKSGVVGTETRGDKKVGSQATRLYAMIRRER